MSCINTKRVGDQVTIVDNFYNFQQTVPNNDYDIVLSFLKKAAGNDEQAEIFAASLFRIANETNTPVTTYLEDLQDVDSVTLSLKMAYYINNTRSNSVLLGVGRVITPNYYVARNIVE